MTLTNKTTFDYRRLKAYRLLILLEQAVKMKEWLVSLIAELLVSMLLRLICKLFAHKVVAYFNLILFYTVHNKKKQFNWIDRKVFG